MTCAKSFGILVKAHGGGAFWLRTQAEGREKPGDRVIGTSVIGNPRQLISTDDTDLNGIRIANHVARVAVHTMPEASPIRYGFEHGFKTGIVAV